MNRKETRGDTNTGILTGEASDDIYAPSLRELREKEAKQQRDFFAGLDGEDADVTIRAFGDLWLRLKTGLKKSTAYHYERFLIEYIYPEIGNRKIKTLKTTDIKLFYNDIINVRNLKIGTLININIVLNQIMQSAIEDNLILSNPCTGAMKDFYRVESAKAKRRKGLTR